MAAVVLVGAAGAALAYQRIERSERSREADALAERAERLDAALEARVEGWAVAMGTFRTLGPDGVDRDTFLHAAEVSLADRDREGRPTGTWAGMTSLAWIETVAPGDVDGRLADLRAETGSARSTSPAADNFLLTYHSDPALQERLGGINLAPLPNRLPALTAARDTGDATLTQFFVPAADFDLPPAERRYAASLYVPVYGGGPVPLSVAERRAGLTAAATTTLRADELLADVVAGEDGLAAELVAEAEGLQRVVGRVGPVVDTTTVRDVWALGHWWQLRVGAADTLTSPGPLMARPGPVAAATLLGASVVAAVIGLLSRDRHRAEALATTRAAELRATEGSLRTLAESLPLGVVEIGDGTYANEAFRVMTGQTEGEGIVDAWIRHVHPEDRYRIVPAIEAAVRGESCLHVHYRGTTPSAPWIDAVATPVATGPGVGRVVAVLRNAGAEVELQDRLRQARDEAVAVSGLKDRFLANMSHEIRTPMNGILGSAELALGDDLDERTRGRFQIISDTGRQLLSVLDDILDLTKVQAGEMRFVSRPFSAVAVADQVVSLHSPRAATGVVLRVTVTSAVPAAVVGDEDRTRQIVANLVSNAIKFTASGEIVVGLDWRDGALVITVTDTGIGIEASDVGQVFDAFRQVDPSSRRAASGTGLGLAICRELAEHMGGTIRVRSSPGVGSTFTVVLPAPASAEGAVPVTAGLRGQRPVWSGGRHLLVAEDNDVNRRVAVEALERLGFTVSTATNGFEALRIVAREPIELVLMDCHMPEMDGFQATVRLRSDPAYRHLPIVAMTAAVFAEDRERCRAAGMDGWLPKPFTTDSLTAALAAHLPPDAIADADPVAVDTGPAPGPGPADSGPVPGPELVATGPGTVPELVDPVRVASLRADHGDLYAELVDAFAAQVDPMLADAAVGDDATALRCVHTLAGSARALGATGLAALLATLEADLRAGLDHVDRVARLAEVEHSVRAGLAELRRLSAPALT